MATTTLGKRKRESKEEVTKGQANERAEPSASGVDAQEIFRRHFEAQFKPLPVLRKPTQETADAAEYESEEETDWDGISDGEDGGVHVVEHKEVQAQEAKMSREELKTFMSSKPPSSTAKPLLPNTTSTTAEDDPSEIALLKNDLALQRLLSESHLLSSSTANSTTTLDLNGTNRHKATDLRLQALGSKKSLFAQEKMPLSHRRGMEKKGKEREERRRREARENGVVLEKFGGKVRREEKKRERGVGKPGVGRFEGGALRLSKKDVFEIQGDSGGGRGGRGGGGRGRGKRGR